jgi:hypothetical protein
VNFSGFYDTLSARHEKGRKKGSKKGSTKGAKRATVNNPIDRWHAAFGWLSGSKKILGKFKYFEYTNPTHGSMGRIWLAVSRQALLGSEGNCWPRNNTLLLYPLW